MSSLADVSRLIARELATLRDELLAYPDDASVWALPAGVPNSAGTLTLHLAGNLRWFVGAQLGATAYVRDREAEFATRDLPRAELMALIERTADEVTRSLAALDPEALDGDFPLERARRCRSGDRLCPHRNAQQQGELHSCRSHGKRCSSS